MKNRTIATVFIMLCFGMIIPIFRIGSVKAGTITVPDQYPSIQAAINAANPGDTVFVRNGVYLGNLTINKPLSLVGESREKTIVGGRPSAPIHWTTITIGADGVVVDNLTIANDGVGISVQSSNCIISGNNLVNNSGVGIMVFGENSNNTLKNNYVDECGFCGVFLGWGPNRNLLFENTIEWCNKGLDMNFSSYNTVKQNIIRNCVNASSDGIFLVGSPYNNFTENTITGNVHGVGLAGSNDSNFYHNNFINIYQVYDYAFNPPYWYTPSHNTWNGNYPSGGNFWSNYIYSDSYRGQYQNITGPDGIGDYPFFIYALNVDRFPLMGQFGSLTKVGSNSTVFPANDLGIIFSNVILAGSTTVNATSVGPANYNINGSRVGEYFDIKTTAQYSGTIMLRITFYDPKLANQTEENIFLSSLRLMHFDNSTRKWVDITTGIDKANDVIYGQTDHFSIFGVTSNSDIVGDVNHDGKVNVLDLIIIASHLGQSNGGGYTPYSDQWYQLMNCDLNGDSKINVLDLIICATHLGQHSP